MADVITLDFETAWDVDYSLSKMSTEAYVRDPRFHVFGVGIKVNDKPAVWISEHDDIPLALASLDIPNNAILAHHAQFDGFILSHHYGLSPKVWFDTLSMARALVGVDVGGSLAKLSKHFGLGEKGHEVENTKGLKELTPQQDKALGSYCVNDVELTYKLFHAMIVGFPQSELKLIDAVVRMFTEPMLRLDFGLLKESLEEIQANKLSLLIEAGVSKEELMSNNKFAEMLKRYGVEPPMKISNTTGKLTYAFAKTDAAMKALLEHDNPEVQAIVAARMGVKSTIAETRTEAFMGISGRGAAPVYLKYSGAQQTHRLSGGDKVNWQNLGRGSKLRDAVMAPQGFKLVVVDSSNIESRILDYLADQKNALEAYRANDRGEGEDIYCFMASQIYGRPITKKENPDERFLGKVAKLGLGYGMGPEKFLATARMFGVPDVDSAMASMTTNVYRSSHDMVVKLWRKFEQALPYIASGKPYIIDTHNIIVTEKDAVKLPNGLRIRFPDLRHEADGWTFWGGRERIKIYGGKGIENIVQALARIVVMDQTLALAKKYKLVLSVHDEAVFCVPENQAEQCLADALESFRTSPKWAPDMPLNAAGDIGIRYGDAK
jgi:DNA polymerase